MLYREVTELASVVIYGLTPSLVYKQQTYKMGQSSVPNCTCR